MRGERKNKSPLGRSEVIVHRFPFPFYAAIIINGIKINKYEVYLHLGDYTRVKEKQK